MKFRRDLAFVLTALLFSFAFLLFSGMGGFRARITGSAGGNALFSPSGAQAARTPLRARGRVESTDDSMVRTYGSIRQGEQQLRLSVLSGKFKGSTLDGTNNLAGKLEVDRYYAPGDEVLLALDLNEAGTEIVWANAVDHYRTGKTIILVVLFSAFLVLISGWTGFKVLVSVLFSGTAIICVLVPAMLAGRDPLYATLALTIVLTAVIIFLVAGFTRTGLSAFSGAAGGVLLTAVLSWAFTRWFNLHGAVRPFAEALLYSGYGHLDLSRLFMSGIFLASSGAVMDLAMDIAVAMAEVKEQQPSIPRGVLLRSGLTISRHVTGTMVTTLVLAYSAEYTAMLMTFAAQGIPFENILNLVFVSSEIVHTFVGCFGLILVAPLTVACSALVLGRKS
ncbi:YibE/F family protein [Treponema zuelzerae]|uniref:YibE/F family protein n=1 Tax=Teretinema zuelzerae TaxID=156 RepID=A0AAE3EJL9_9SPIR|nr:YibE/F family protein [Teretinema zuelzerae]MCD1655702.1 YibE/F family protein [Teretinema zuelzerae]